MNRIDRRVLFTSGAAAALLAATGVSAQTTPHRGGRLRAALSGA
ncbi:MAG: peptide ABC transporter substrate-binding protein, partial [Rhodobacteraceae bacterium]|nr:peptide ABC transporter substrate-binding protein [Paracoccaceae bacterium]